jgi:hypothetical protein
MEVPYSKDPANHADPELCGRGRKVAFEALVGEYTGRVLNLEKVVQSANVVQITEGNTSTGDRARRCWALRGRRPRACVEVSCTETGRPIRTPRYFVARVGKP